MGASQGADFEHISIHALLAESDYPIRIMVTIIIYFYPRSPCGERRLKAIISSITQIFLSTLSLRRATPALHNILKLFSISIHALLAESDEENPTQKREAKTFLSTLSLRRAT